MANSRKLIDDLARATGLRPESILVSIRTLREDGLISVSGRGISAATMTRMDAATVMIGIGSGATISRFARTTRLLMEMPFLINFRPGCVTFKLVDEPPSITKSLTFSGAVERLLASDMPDYPGRKSITIGMDGTRKRAFGVIHWRNKDGNLFRDFYSNCALKPEIVEADLQAMTMFVSPIGYFHMAHFGEDVFATVSKTLDEPTSRKRHRK